MCVCLGVCLFVHLAKNVLPPGRAIASRLFVPSATSPPPPTTPASPIDELSSIRGSASAIPETVETPSLQLTPQEVLQSPDSSPSLQPAQHSPRPPPTSTMASPTSAVSTDELTRLRLRLRHATAHLVDLAAMVAQLPPLTPDMRLMAATLGIRAHFTVYEITTVHVAQLQGDTVYTGAPLLVKITFLHTVGNSDNGHSPVTR